MIASEEMGLLTMASVLVQGLHNVFSDIGIGPQHHPEVSVGNQPDYLNTAWTISNWTRFRIVDFSPVLGRGPVAVVFPNPHTITNTIRRRLMEKHGTGHAPRQERIQQSETSSNLNCPCRIEIVGLIPTLISG